MVLQTTDGYTFDGIVYAEQSAQTWMAGSDHHRRTRPFEAPREKDADRRPVRLIITYAEDGTVTAYRDGEPYGKPYPSAPIAFTPGNSQVVFGTRHGTKPSPGRALTGKIFEARLYDRALTAAEAAAASTGALQETVTEQMIADALRSSPERYEIAAFADRIAPLVAEQSRLGRELDEAKRKKQQAGDAYFRLAHAILNSKELIYVH